MTRRRFSGVLAGLGAASPGLIAGDSSSIVVLTAIAGARLPQTLAVAIRVPKELREGVWELRTYRGTAPAFAAQLADVFPRVGIRPLLSGADGADLAYLIPFANLTARDHAWTVLNADAQWIGARSGFQSYHFCLYRSE